jgi:hypothetical protein
MSFDCPHFVDDICRLQKGPCNPATGKCILKGKAVKAKNIKSDELKMP